MKLHDHLRMWIVYDHPAEAPDEWVVKEWIADSSGLTVASRFACGSLTEIRLYIQSVDPRAIRHTQPSDDPKITEFWI